MKKTTTNHSIDEKFTFTEFKHRFFPNTNLDVNEEQFSISSESFIEIIKKISTQSNSSKNEIVENNCR